MLGTAVRRLREHTDAISEEWIGLSFPPAEQALVEANWTSDAPDSYCHRCGDSIGPGEATESGCSTCREGAELSGGIGSGVVRLGPYTDHLRAWVRAVKYQRWTEMGEALGRRLGQHLIELKVITPSYAVVVPMPMPWPRRLYRGVDHTRVIADGVARELGAPIVKILTRSMQPPQVSLVPSARKRAGARGLRIRRRLTGFGRLELAGIDVVLIDDVRTTGATLKAATRLLQKLKPAKVVCAVIAVSDSTARRDRISARGLRDSVQSPP